jgi:hypothetical protein
MRRILFLPLLLSILLASVHARADNAALGEVDAPGAATGRYMGGRPGVERPLHRGHRYRHHHSHYQH